MLNRQLSKMDKNYELGSDSLVEEYADRVTLPKYTSDGLIFRIDLSNLDGNLVAYELCSLGSWSEDNLKNALALAAPAFGSTAA